MTLDPRLNAFRPDLANERLKGKVAAEKFCPGQLQRITAAVADICNAPGGDAQLLTQALHGEQITIFESRNGWSWGQLARDGYVGYIASAALAPMGAPATHYVQVPAALAYPEADLKCRPASPVHMMSEVSVTGLSGDFAQLADGRFIFARHLRSIGEHATDPASVAGTFQHVPYLWGGKTSTGLDCSGLIQLAWQACGLECPRDSDMIEAAIGDALQITADCPLQRNDLVFWKGHLGLMLDPVNMIHANGHHMLTVIEPASQAIARIARLYGPVTGYKRPVLTK